MTFSDQIKKALRDDTIAGSWELTKAWGDEQVTYIEGWMSTPARDTENHIVEPEAFLESLDPYFALRAPLSYIHQGKTLPAGHLQKAAIVRDGQVLKTAAHPSDAAEFESFPGTGTGVYVRAVITDPSAAKSIKVGNTGGMSWIGHGRAYDPMPGGVKRFTKVSPLIESTVAPYPINQTAVITMVKANQEEPMDEATKALLVKIAERMDAEETAKAASADAEKLQKAVEDAVAAAKAEMDKVLAEKEAALAAKDEELQKALVRAPGVGRVSTQAEGAADPLSEAARDANPNAYILAKAQKLAASDTGMDAGLDVMDKALVAHLTKTWLMDGLVMGDE